MELELCNSILDDFATLIEEKRFREWSGELKTGVDLGTANIVLAVLDEENTPIAGASYPSSVVKDGIVVDYIGASRVVQKLKHELEAMLGVELENGACAIPPGIIEGNKKIIGNVVEAAGFELKNVVDEPTAAAQVLGITDGAVVDVGGGTTGISILKDGKVIFTGDEPTGGTHMTLVLAGFHGCSIEEAEAMKIQKSDEIFPIIRPVVDKMATIVSRYISGYDVENIYIVGGACCFSQFEDSFENSTGIRSVKPLHPLLVTPLGIAMSC